MSNMTYSIIERSCNKILVGKTYWEMVIIPSLLFASAVINWNKTELDTLQRSEDGVWRKILGAPGYTPLVAMRGDLGVSTIIARDLKSKLKYIQHVFKSENELLEKILIKVIENKHPYGKRILRYMEMVNVSQIIELRSMSEREVSKRVDEWVHGEWRSEINEKSTLAIYRNFKQQRKEEGFCNNTMESVLLFKARSNCLKLNWRNRFLGGDIGCKLCGEREETLEHFLLECPGYREERMEFNMIDVEIKRMLGFESYEMGNTKRFLKKIWFKRKNFIDAGNRID